MRKIFFHPGIFPILTILTASLVAGAMLTSCTAPKVTQDGQSDPTGVLPLAGGPTTGGAIDPNRITLTQSIQDGIDGLSFETAETRERLDREAAALAAMRKGKLPRAQRKSRADDCQRKAESAEPSLATDESIFCRLWIESNGARPKRPKRAPRLSSTASGRKRLAELKRAIEGGKLELLADANDSELREALKKSRDLVKLRPLIERALGQAACAPTELMTSLGQKTEEKFPDADHKELAQALYKRSTECGNDLAAGRAAYRLGLLQIWDQKYQDAEKTLEWLTRNPAAEDYHSRITYWRYFCAKQTGNVALRERMRDKLAKDYHLTLHGLITVGPKSVDNDPRVAFRSITRPELNAPVRVAEALLDQGDKFDAVAALEPVLDQMSTSEPQFQLYVGLLLKRAGDSIRKFRLLTGLYRDYPGLISRESLEMLFPLHRFEMVRNHERKADPFLMISLIRQESAFNERARSPVGARGLMQLMPRTARRMERVSKNALYDPNVNIRLGVRFFSLLSNRYGGEAELALAAYNAGPLNVDTWQSRYPVSNRLLFVDLIPFKETREYVASIARNYFWYKKLYEDQGPGETAREPAFQQQQQEKFSFFKLFDS